MTYKQQLHSNLSALIHNAVKNKKNYKSSLNIPISELIKEAGFAESDIPGELQIVITAEFVNTQEELS